MSARLSASDRARYAARAARASLAVSLSDSAYASIASASVGARPSCMYGAVEPTPHKFSVRNVSGVCRFLGLSGM